MKIVIAGATGLIGSALVKRLLKDDHVVVALTRRQGAFKNLPSADLKTEIWDGQTVGGWDRQLADADVLVNLAGESIAGGPWTVERKRLIKASRLNATRALVQAMAGCINRPNVLINASAVGYYGNVPEGDVTETASKGKGYLADVCADWEHEAREAERLGVRVVRMRFGVVLDKEAGALAKFLPPFRMFLGGPLGSGSQWFPWVHREDVVQAILFAIHNEKLSGAVNVTAPESLNMRQFCQALGRALKKPCWAPVPAFVLNLMLGEMSELLLAGQKALPRALQDAGYLFQYPTAERALANLLQK